MSRGIPALFGLIRFMGERKAGSVVTENPKGGITENFGRISERGPLKFARKTKTKRVGGTRKSSFRGDHFSEVTFKQRGIC